MRGEVIRGWTESAGGDDQVGALRLEESQRGLEVPRPVADAQDVRDVDAELAEPFGDPGAVAVTHPAGDQLGTGDDNSRAHDSCGHGQFRPLKPTSRMPSASIA